MIDQLYISLYSVYTVKIHLILILLVVLSFVTYFIEITPCNKSIICGVLFASGKITFYEGNNMLSALL